MKSLLTLIGIFLFSISTYCQQDTTQNFLYLHSDVFVFGKVTALKSTIGMPSFEVDSTIFHYKRVKFYRDNTGFYGKTHKPRSINYIPRIRGGKINLFRDVRTGYQGGPGEMSGSGTKYNNYFYSRGFNDLKKVKYKYLIVELADYQPSQDILNRYRKTRNNQITVFAASTILLATTSIWANSSLPGNEEIRGDKYKVPVILGIGTSMVGFIYSYFLTYKKEKYLIQSIDVYNRYFNSLEKIAMMQN